MSVLRRLLPALLAAALLATASGCADDAAGEDGRLGVVATTTQAADLVRSVAGDRARTIGLIPANADPHDYELRPDDVRELARAGLVVRSGGDLDAWLEDALESAGRDDADVVSLIDHVRRRGEDPHWWPDPRNAVLAVAAIRDALARTDPDGAATYRRNAAAYTRRIRALDRAIAGCMAAVAPARRKLVTTHDSLGAFADRYGLELVGAVIPSLSTRGQPSAGETARLVATIRRERVPAVFTERALSAGVERAIAREAGARVGAPLYADALGPEGSDGATYLEALAADARAIADGLSGRRAGCRAEA